LETIWEGAMRIRLFVRGVGDRRDSGPVSRPDPRAALPFALVAALATATFAAAPVELPVPDGVLPPEIPAENPLTGEKVELGKALYFEKRLSTDGTISCATCHDPRTGFADRRGKSTSSGVGDQLGTRNAPTTLNAAFLAKQFWDGRAANLEEQATKPLSNPIEHGFKSDAEVIAKLDSLKGEYGPRFKAAFGSDQITIERVGQAIASFERTLISLDAPIDRFLAGDKTAISESAQRGWDLFNNKARCNTCHGHIGALPLFTNDDFHNIGVGVSRLDFAKVSRDAAAQVLAGKDVDKLALSDPNISELGRFLITGEQKHMGAFKTPQLRNVALTAPYMHDGSEATLAAVIDYYDKGGNPNPFLDGGMRPLKLTPQEKADLVALMETFTSSDLDRFKPLADLMK
jgi:cytochrome c peroxidase